LLSFDFGSPVARRGGEAVANHLRETLQIVQVLQ
jgi:hypothetical protein